MKEIAREKSQRGKTQKVIALLVLLGIGALWYMDSTTIRNGGGLSPAWLFLNFVWFGFWIWKVIWRYELILRPRELEIISSGFFTKRSYILDLDTVQGIMPKYHHNFFKKTGIKHYIHRFSMADPNPCRMISFTEGKDEHLAALIFCCSDRFMDELRKLKPERYMEFI